MSFKFKPALVTAAIGSITVAGSLLGAAKEDQAALAAGEKLLACTEGVRVTATREKSGPIHLAEGCGRTVRMHATKWPATSADAFEKAQ